MAGGWGYSVTQPMEIPQEPPLRYLDDDMPEVKSPGELPLPDAPNVDTSRLRILNKALPQKPGGEIQQQGRMEAAAQEAAAIGNAFAVTKMYNKAYAQRAKAKGRAMERAAQHRSDRAVDAGKKYDNRNDAYSRYSTFRAAQAFGHHPHDGMY